MQLGELALRLGREVEGDSAFEVRGVAGPEGGASDLGFVRSPAHAAALRHSALGALIAPPGVAVGARPVIRSPAPSLDFARACALIAPPKRPAPGIHPRAAVAEDARIHQSAHIGALCAVGSGAAIGPRSILHAHVCIGEGVQIGADCVLHSGVVVREGVQIGDRVILQPGALIGGDGFGFELNEQGRFEKVPQLGRVEIGDDVEIGAGATVDRARLGATRIGRGVKVDNLVMVAHNVEIGADSLLVAQCGVAGGARLGDRVLLMAQSGVGGHIQIGDGSFIGARAGVIEDTPPQSRLWGFPALPERAWHRTQSLLSSLGDFVRRLRRVERATFGGDGSERSK